MQLKPVYYCVTQSQFLGDSQEEVTLEIRLNPKGQGWRCSASPTRCLFQRGKAFCGPIFVTYEAAIEWMDEAWGKQDWKLKGA